MVIAGPLRREMRRRSLTESSIARAAGVSQATIHSLLKGSEPRITTFVRLVALFPAVAAPFYTELAAATKASLRAKTQFDVPVVIDDEPDDADAPDEADDDTPPFGDDTDDEPKEDGHGSDASFPEPLIARAR